MRCMLVYFWILSAGSLQQHLILSKNIAEAVRKEWFFAHRYLFKWLCDFKGKVLTFCFVHMFDVFAISKISPRLARYIFYLERFHHCCYYDE